MVVNRMDVITGSARFRCECCGQGYELTNNDIHFQISKGLMGENGTHYVADVKELCFECGADIEIQFNAWLHPKGSIVNTKEDTYGVESLVARYEPVTSTLSKFSKVFSA